MASKRIKSVNSGKPKNYVPQTEDTSTDRASSLKPKFDPDPDMYGGVHRSILEAFDNLNWHDDMSPEQHRSFMRHWIPPGEESVSHAMKLLNSEFVKFPTREITLPPWPKDEESATFYLPGLKSNHQTVLPKMSVLTRRDQTKLYGFYCYMTFKNRRLPITEQELAKFQELRTKVAGEYAEFQEYAKSEWYKGQWKRALLIPPQVEQFIDCLWKMRAGQCLTGYPDEYKSVRQVPLALHDPNQDFSVFEFVKQVYTQSFPPKMGILKIKDQPVKLISKFEDLNRIKPVSEDISQNVTKPLLKPTPPVSFDRNVESLLKRVDLDIDAVISMSGIKTLVDNVKFQREWVLPITVKDVLKNDGETVKRVVIIDKNLPPKYMSVHEKNLWHAKVVAKWMLVLSKWPYIFDEMEELRHSMGKGTSESYENMLSDVAEKLNVERSTENVEMKSEQPLKSTKPAISLGQQKKSEPSVVKHELGASCNKPRTKSSLENNLEARAKGGRVLTSYDDLLSDGDQLKAGRAPTDVDVKPKQQCKRGDQRACFNKPKTFPLQEKNITSRKRERQSLVSYDDPFSDFDGQDLEEFGVDPAPPRNVQTKQRHIEQDIRPKETAPGSSVEGGSPVKKIKETEKEDSSGWRRKIIESEVGDIPATGFERLCLTETALRKGTQAPCLQYQIWNLHKSKYIQFLKLEQRSLNVLVRSRKDGKWIHLQDLTRVWDDVCVSSKVEFQPEYGASKMAASELIREYVDLYMRPNSKLMRVRSIGHTKEVMMTEMKTISEIKTALQVEVRQIQKLFDPLYAVLTKLIDLVPGRYMLQHTAKMGPFATLFMETPGWANFNLLQYCQELTTVEVNVPPMPIDPLVLTSLQHRDRLAPALFTPGYSESSQNGYFSKPQPGLKSKKRKKAKNKKKPKTEKLLTDDEDESFNSKDLSDSAESLGIDTLWAPK